MKHALECFAVGLAVSNLIGMFIYGSPSWWYFGGSVVGAALASLLMWKGSEE